MSASFPSYVCALGNTVRAQPVECEMSETTVVGHTPPASVWLCPGDDTWHLRAPAGRESVQYVRIDAEAGPTNVVDLLYLMRAAPALLAALKLCQVRVFMAEGSENEAYQAASAALDAAEGRHA
jgi:hypothetical protein